MKVYLILLISVFSTAVCAQRNAAITGIWEGKINVGVTLRIVFHFKDSLGTLTGTTDSPDQGITGIPCANVITRNDSLLLEVPEFKGRYAGKFLNDTTIQGKLTQSAGIDLLLSKVKKTSALNRPQTPHPPFPYKTEDITYHNRDHTIIYGATLSIPKGKGPFPAVLLVTGSGAQNRDEEIFEHKPFAVIADHLVRQGYIVMRVDDRGVGKTTGNFATATTADFMQDANISLDYLKERKETDKNHLGIIGHSEGGMIAAMLASARPGIDFIILLAAPGKKIPELMEDQNWAILLSRGFTQTAADAYCNLYREMIPVITSAKDTTEAAKKLHHIVSAWRKITSKGIVMGTTGISSDSTQQLFVNAFASSLATPWYKYFLEFDPQVYLSKLSCSVLALNGDKDLQVISASNLAAIKQALQQGRSRGYEVRELPGLNHLFQSCKKCTLAEYGQLEESFSPSVLAIMTKWLRQNVGRGL
jgi:pimeloyl-ACP methyl ester carboxylesterase